MRPKTPLLTVDGVIILNRKIVLIKRKNEPYRGSFALPGGFVEIGETTEEAVKREVMEETGLLIEILKLVGVYSDPSRDPRGHTVSVAYLAVGKGEPKADTDAADVGCFDPNNLPELAFDHQRILNDAGDDIDGVLSKM
ncbi:NUDIX domain-containing protein [Methanohalophilus portucalensis]|uniref:8-oxo-dGTP diphosphatase n=2 Tax=Methanohalophilus portucalensis TaxID=39664 RepID=A0A1L9C5T1_9EURY|nr:NUDIX hydrolase [Methanohalophilus portucalensis]ATU08525.1 DNA mismatch repair protein MutT [Methanohalophilus portucalensis]OJH49885.1 NUDIX hydrolase [Methanohalophilus portucalensis FDF-1]RNI13304.1 NUDIX hydrolase [Methanohalophilus portucalensis FDF-1]SMH33169.1 8-oxo-dGTP diphosphatase [Methanohalophilus portucalensis FDF-1]